MSNLVYMVIAPGAAPAPIQTYGFRVTAGPLVDWPASYAKAQAECDELQMRLKRYEPINTYNGKDIVQWKAEAEALRRALELYGEHRPDCPHNPRGGEIACVVAGQRYCTSAYFDRDHACTCGYHAALA